MIVSAKKIIELNKKYNLIENLSERELKNPEGVGIDIRFDEVYKLKNKGFLGVTKRNTPDVEKIVLEPGEFILIKTIEKVNLPGEKIEINGEPTFLMADVCARSTILRSGIDFLMTKVDIGYSGTLTFGLANIGPFPFELELGARVANLIFKKVSGDISRPYEGQWQDGRVTSPKEEEQN